MVSSIEIDDLIKLEPSAGGRLRGVPGPGMSAPDALALQRPQPALLGFLSGRQ